MCIVTLSTYIYCQELAEFQVLRIFNGKIPSYQLRELNSIRLVYRESVYPPLAQFAGDGGYELSAFWSTEVRQRFPGGGLGYLLKAECLAFHCRDGEEGGRGLCLLGRNIFDEQTPGLSNQSVLISVNQPRTHSVFTSTRNTPTFP